MKKGNSVTKKVRRRRRIGGKYPKSPKNPIETIPGTQRPRRQPPRTPPSSVTGLQPNGPGNVPETLNLLLSFGRTRSPQRRNGGKTYKNKYKTKTP
jgi:hypothetical protein